MLFPKHQRESGHAALQHGAVQKRYMVKRPLTAAPFQAQKKTEFVFLSGFMSFPKKSCVLLQIPK